MPLLHFFNKSRYTTVPKNPAIWVKFIFILAGIFKGANKIEKL